MFWTVRWSINNSKNEWLLVLGFDFYPYRFIVVTFVISSSDEVYSITYIEAYPTIHTSFPVGVYVCKTRYVKGWLKCIICECFTHTIHVNIMLDGNTIDFNSSKFPWSPRIFGCRSVIPFLVHRFRRLPEGLHFFLLSILSTPTQNNSKSSSSIGIASLLSAIMTMRRSSDSHYNAGKAMRTSAT